MAYVTAQGARHIAEKRRTEEEQRVLRMHLHRSPLDVKGAIDYVLEHVLMAAENGDKYVELPIRCHPVLGAVEMAFMVTRLQSEPLGFSAKCGFGCAGMDRNLHVSW